MRIINFKGAIVLCTCFVLLLCSCAEKDRGNNEDEEIVTINALNNTNRIQSFFDLFELNKIVALKTDEANLIGKIKRVRVVPDNIFIFDNLRNTIFRFDSEGNFLNFIGKKGGGPEELIHPIDFWVDVDNEKIIFLDNQKKIVEFTFSGEFLNKIKIPVYTQNIAKITDDKYLLVSENSYNDGRLNFLFFIDKQGNIIDEKISFMEDLVENSFNLSTGINFFEDEYTMCFPLNDTIYSLKDDNLYKKYIINFENQKLDKDVFKRCNGSDEVIKKVYETNKILYIHNYLETNDICYAVFWKGHNTLETIIFSKKTGKIYNYNGNSISDILRGSFVSATSKGQMIYIYQPYLNTESDFNFRLKFMDNNYSENESYQQFKKQCITQEKIDNPVLLLFEFKKEM